MHQRRRRLAVGVVVVALATGGAWSIGADGPRGHVASAQARPTRYALGTVSPDGLLTTAGSGWRAARTNVGTYLLELPPESAVDLRSWTAVATVTTKPVSATAWTVTFTTGDGQRVDTAFTFRASPSG